MDAGSRKLTLLSSKSAARASRNQTSIFVFKDSPLTSERLKQSTVMSSLNDYNPTDMRLISKHSLMLGTNSGRKLGAQINYDNGKQSSYNHYLLKIGTSTAEYTLENAPCSHGN